MRKFKSWVMDEQEEQQLQNYFAHVREMVAKGEEPMGLYDFTELEEEDCYTCGDCHRSGEVPRTCETGDGE